VRPKNSITWLGFSMADCEVLTGIQRETLIQAEQLKDSGEKLYANSFDDNDLMESRKAITTRHTVKQTRCRWPRFAWQGPGSHAASI
jgi:hypothetical protein